ncbi:CtsR family transcriptional regulator [Ligilactobacillus equi]|uniref:Transcriptional regulator CtsR n=2 Tax=Ligilactobacillus equi TaxID=137357 RepID=V7HWP3_9LACO|nr:CtsR family transcriptional regulator [Ligilactobacillus equi]ETA74317.1 transcriptional regulator CtsR [Ligilactobacillus equi DPC 6820]KRL81144.1 transcriptional regulator CtsR [Ligilactobacillus equi DSM 15833 = JCM 10991]
MQERNISDIIERYLKEILNDANAVEIKRSEVARRFDCVPSQINYVIKTRFTLPNGYLVESKRGGGGYIRIAKINLVDNTEMFQTLLAYIGEQISTKQAWKIIQGLYDDQILSKREANLILATLDQKTVADDGLRAQILKAILERLKYSN